MIKNIAKSALSFMICHALCGGVSADAKIMCVTSDQSSMPVVKELVKAFAVQSPSLRVKLRKLEATRLTSNKALKTNDLLTRTIFCEKTRELTPHSLLASFPVARKSISIVANNANPVQSLTESELHNIYAGRLFFWDETRMAKENAKKRANASTDEKKKWLSTITSQYDVDAVNAKKNRSAFKVYNLTPNNACREVFDRLVLKEAATTLSSEDVGDSQTMMKLVSNESGALGYIDENELSNSVKTIEVLNDQDKSPVVLSQVIQFEATRPVSDNLKAFARFVLSPEGRTIIRREGYHPVDYMSPPDFLNSMKKQQADGLKK